MPVITLLTDYGLDDEFAGVCHGVIAGICPEARIIDITHGIPRQDVRAGAFTLARALPYLPIGVHVAIVDPGVGGARRGVALRLSDGRTLVGPDNGLLWPAAGVGGGVSDAVEISGSRWRLEPVSATFHGRDIFAPVAAALAAGHPLETAGEPIDPAGLQMLELPEPRVEEAALVASVVWVDRFGNAQLAARSADLRQPGWSAGGRLRIDSPTGESLTASPGRTFSDVEEGECVLLEDSAGHLALAINRDNVAERLGLRIGDEIRISPR